MTEPQKPGEKPARPGRYHETGPRGGQVSNPREVRITPDDGHLPSLASRTEHGRQAASRSRSDSREAHERLPSMASIACHAGMPFGPSSWANASRTSWHRRAVYGFCSL